MTNPQLPPVPPATGPVPVPAAASPASHPPAKGEGGSNRLGAVLGGLALVLAVVALAVGVANLLKPPAVLCATPTWDSRPAAGDLPAGWSYVALNAWSGGGYGASIGQPSADDSSVPPSPSIYWNVTCNEDAPAVFAAQQAMDADVKDTNEIGFAKIGDELRATKSDSGTVEVSIRVGDKIVSVTAYDTDTPLNDVEDLARTVVESLAAK